MDSSTALVSLFVFYFVFSVLMAVGTTGGTSKVWEPKENKPGLRTQSRGKQMSDHVKFSK